MRQVGRIREIWRYPVKGMAGESIEHSAVGKSGVAGDRMWALRDVERGEIQSCKFRPELLLCTAKSRGETVEIEFPDGRTIPVDDPRIHECLSELVGRESTLERLPVSLENDDFFRRFKGGERGWLEELNDTFTREPGEAGPDFTEFPQEAQDFVTVRGTFFLVGPFHLVTTGTLDFLKATQPGADWDIRRFRPNVLVETNSDEVGLVEQGWIGRALKIGGLEVDCSGTAIRCGAVTRPQKGILSDKSMLRTIVGFADQNVGVYGNIRQEGELSLGDEVHV